MQVNRTRLKVDNTALNRKKCTVKRPVFLFVSLLAATAAAQETLELRLTVDRVDEKLRVAVRLIGADLGETKPAVFLAPIPSRELRELRWYLEDSWRWPSEVDKKRVAEIEANMRGWGEGLWTGVFSDGQRLRVWQRFADATTLKINIALLSRS